MKKSIIVKPFIKWAGGKSQLINEIQKRYPKELGKTITKYCETFVGGGAVLFDILSKYNMKQVFINDINTELINTYKQIQQNSDSLIERLSELQSEFWALDKKNRAKMYLEKREQFNILQLNDKNEVKIEKAVLFIFLNKTCFNGLYRVNKRGLFNVPIGAYKHPLICDEKNLRTTSQLLQNVQINCGDYRECYSFIDRNTFVYFDPPYRPLNHTSNFTAYTKEAFDDTNQIELKLFIDKIHSLGAKFLLSNSDPKNSDEDDCFFEKLYEKYNIDRVYAKRMINCDADKRGDISELLIYNY